MKIRKDQEILKIEKSKNDNNKNLNTSGQKKTNNNISNDAGKGNVGEAAGKGKYMTNEDDFWYTNKEAQGKN